MSKTTLRSLLFALAGVLTLNLCAAPSWTTGSCTPGEWQSLEGNLLLNVKGSSTATGVSGYSSSDLAVLTDGKVPTAAPDKDGIFGFRSGENISWTFAEPKTLEQIRICTCYLTGAAYDGVHVSKVEVMPFGGGWTQIAGDCEYKGEGAAGKINYIVLSNGGDPVEQSIVGLRVTFGTCETGFANYYAEIEAVGSTAALGPVLGSFGVTPAKTKAKVSGLIAEVGDDATACDVYLSLDGAAEVKIAEGVTGSFEYMASDLTPGTAYTYELSVYNDAPTPKKTVRSGSFTTLGDSDPTSVWQKDTYMPTVWQPLSKNVLAGVKGKMVVGSPNGYGSSDIGVLSDGGVPSAAGKDWIVGIGSNSEIDWAFEVPVALEQLRISSCYLADPRYSGVNIAAVKVKHSDSDEWVTLPQSSSDKQAGDGSTKNVICATLSDVENGCLAEDVIALKVVFGGPVYANANYFAEVEAVGSIAASGPVLGTVSVNPAKTKAMIAGEILSPGSDATACDVYLSLDGADPIKIAGGVTDAFEHEIPGLSPETQYCYELTVSNNAEPSMETTKSGEFTTLPASEQTAKWETSVCAPDAWTALKGNMLKGKVGTTEGSLSYLAKNVEKLTDGAVPNPVKDTELCGFCNPSSIKWTFDEDKTLVKLRLSSQTYWGGRQYHRIWVDSVKVKYSEEGEWVPLAVPGLQFSSDSTAEGNVPFAILADAETGVLAENIRGLQIDFSTDGTMAFYYAEIEAAGYASADEATKPELADPVVETLTATKAVVSDSLTNIGQKALYATLSFAWGTDPAALGDPEQLTDNAVAGTVYGATLTDLTPETTYHYKFIAQNDAVGEPMVRTGSFTTPGLTRVDCSLVVPVGASVTVGETTYTSSATLSVLQGEEVTFQAVPSEGYVFERWVGDFVEATQASANPLTFAVLQACSIAPVVRPVSESVTVTWNGGEGAWENAAMWDKGFVPTAADAVVIPAGTCTVAGQASVKALSLSGSAKLVVAEPNSGHYGNLAVAGNLVLADAAELHVAAGPLAGDQYTFATGSGFVTVGGTFEIKDAAKFVPCCDQYTGGGVVTKAGKFILASGASVEAISLGYKRFPDLTPASHALGAGTDYYHGASYGGHGDTYLARGAGVAPYGFANAPVHPGSHKYDSSHVDDLTAGGGSVRIHAERVKLDGTVNVSANVAPAQGASSGGGIWITAVSSLKVGPAAKLLAQGAKTANEGFGHGNGAGGRIAFGLGLSDEEIAALSTDGKIPEGAAITVEDQEQFLSTRPGVTVNLASGAPESVETLPEIANSYGTFRFLKGSKTPGFLLQIR